MDRAKKFTYPTKKEDAQARTRLKGLLTKALKRGQTLRTIAESANIPYSSLVVFHNSLTLAPNKLRRLEEFFRGEL